MEDKTSVHNLRKDFGRLEVLKDVSIEIREGGVVCMMDPSSSGKSTFLRCLNHLEKITSGHMVVDDHPISDPNTNINKMRGSIGMVFQHFNLLPHLTVKENITLTPTELELMRKKKAGRKAPELLTRMRLAGKAKTYPGQLSDGQKQRVAVARSLAMNPDIMLFDGPTSALDLEIMGEVLEIMEQLAASSMTVVVVTHRIGFTREMVDRVVFMNERYIVEEGTPDEAFGNPREERTGSFLDRVL